MTGLISCEKDEIEKTNHSNEKVDNLEQIGVLKEWKLETRTINGITELTIQCCDYIEFKADSESTDLKGQFRAHGVGYETNGAFEIDTSSNTIQFDYDSTQKLYNYQIFDDLLSFTYSENNQEIIEDWRKQ